MSALVLFAWLAWALGVWGVPLSLADSMRLELTDRGGGEMYGATTYEPGECAIALTPAWLGLSEAGRRVTVLHETFHCLAGLYHTPCMGVSNAAAVFHPDVTGCDRAYLAPWRAYPWTYERRVVAGVAMDGGAR